MKFYVLYSKKFDTRRHVIDVSFPSTFGTSIPTILLNFRNERRMRSGVENDGVAATQFGTLSSR